MTLPKMKVTVLSGFLGAGKTTLLKRILRENNRRTEEEKLSIAVIVNDMGEINLDADEIKHSKLIQEEAEMVEMHNGCICCTLRGDLLKTVKKLSEEKTFNYLVIESTGISEPLPVAQTFIMDVDSFEADEEDGQDKQLTVAKSDPASLSHYATLDTLVSVVDALNIFDVLSSIETLSEENATGMVGNTGLSKEQDRDESPTSTEALIVEEEVEDTDDRSIAQLMLDQIEFANVIVLSKVQLLLKKEPEEMLEKIKALLHKLNPKAHILAPREDKYGDLDVQKELLETGLFDIDEASMSPEWMEELEKEHTPETEEYGISSVVFRSSKMPFHPGRLEKILDGFGDYGSVLDASNVNGSAKEMVFKGVVRSKGHLWLANGHAFPFSLHTAGKHLGLEANSKPFIAAEEEDTLDEEDRQLREVLKEKGMWDAKFGDRSSELVFIGVNLNKKLILEKLNAALLTEEESKALGGVEGWKKLDDPFFGGKAVEHWFEVEYDEDDEDDEDDGACEMNHSHKHGGAKAGEEARKKRRTEAE